MASRNQFTYILAPNLYMRPDTGPIALGNIIADPFRPHRALTKVDKETLASRYPRIETVNQLNRTVENARNKAISATVWAQFLQTAGLKLSIGNRDASHESYKMADLEISYFVQDPSDEEIQLRVQTPRVQAVMHGDRLPGFRNPIYMVNGLMVAKDFAAIQKRSDQVEGASEVYGTGPTPLGDVGGGLSVVGSSGGQTGATWTMAQDIVFAYQLLEIKIKGLRDPKVVYDEYRSKAAFLSMPDDKDIEEDAEEIIHDEELDVGPATFDGLLTSHTQIRERSADVEGSKVSCLLIDESHG